MTNPQLISYSMVKTKSYSSKIRNKARISTIAILINIVLEVLARAIRKEKEIKGIQIEKEEVKLSLFVNDIILYIENTTDSTKKLLEIINAVKLWGIKSIYKNLLYIYTLTMS